jgi:hypothetical protein
MIHDEISVMIYHCEFESPEALISVKKIKCVKRKLFFYFRKKYTNTIYWSNGRPSPSIRYMEQGLLYCAVDFLNVLRKGCWWGGGVTGT